MPLPALPGLDSLPVADRMDLVATPVARALADAPYLAARVAVAAIDPELADTAALVAAFDLSPAASGNCVVIAGSRAGEERIAAAVVPATTRADVNSLVKKTLDVRKCSFMPHERAVSESGMEYGGITPVGLPAAWRLLVDEALLAEPVVVIGSGLRRSKLLLAGADLALLPGAEVTPGLGKAAP